MRHEEKYNLNFDWRFTKPESLFPLADAQKSIEKNGKAFFELDYNDGNWDKVCVPHAPNACDSFDNVIRDSGEAELYRGFMFYRKHFTLSDVADKKFFLEFEAVRQSIYLYVNGDFVGYYEAGTAPVGFDISAFVVKGDNLVCIATDSAAYRECEFTTIETVPGNTPGDCSGERFQWNQKDFNEVQGGITGNVNLYVTGLVYQTRPLYNNLKTMGNYIYADGFDFEKGSARINVTAEVRNETNKQVDARLIVTIKDSERTVCEFSSKVYSVPPCRDKGVVYKTVVPQDAYSENPTPTGYDTVDVMHISAAEKADGLVFWSIDNPHLYEVYTRLEVNSQMVDTQKTVTGFRQVTYDINRGGLLINGEPTFLKGYAQRSTNEWAVIGVANDYLTDIDMRLVRESGADYIRWMHVTPKPVAIRAGDKYGVVSVCPAGDKETDVSGRMWDMRVEAMRDAIIYFRNSPSVIFYEAGNAAITGEHMREMTELKNAIDPYGYRFMGCRSLTSPEQIKEAEWVGTMVYRYDAHAKQTMCELDKFVPMLETEYKRDESPRRVWDDFSPPDFDYDNKWLGDGAKKTDGYDVWDQTQEEFSVFAASSKDGYAYFYENRVGGETKNDYYSGAAIMVWSDSNMHGRNSGSENCRTTGKVDPVRIPKRAFYALQAMHATSPKVHIIGHWNYPDDTPDNYNYHVKEWNGTYWEKTDKTLRRNPKDKTVYVIASESCYRVELYINGVLCGASDNPRDKYVYAFEHIDVTRHGYIEAIAYNKAGDEVARDKITTAGNAAKIRLTPTVGPDGFVADGSDICYFDVAVTDVEGNICPLSYDKIQFAFTGDGEFLGGYNSGTFNESSVIHKDYCYAECGLNRVFVRSVPNGKSFTLTASAAGLEGCSVTVNYTPFELSGGLTDAPQRAYPINSFVYERIVTESASHVSTAESVKDVYTIYVNGKALEGAVTPYRPDSGSGVLCSIQSVLDALGVKYTCTKDAKQTLEFNGVSLTEGETVIRKGNETNLTNAEFYVENGEIVAEVSAVLYYVDNTEVITDTDNKTVKITSV